jgi:four helix bundle protein
MDLAALSYEIGRRLPSTAAASLRGQLQRSAVSVPANIAEGAGRRSRADFLRHLSIANGSLKELETHLLLVERLALVSRDEVLAALSLADEVGRMLGGLIRSLRTSTQNDPSGR